MPMCPVKHLIKNAFIIYHKIIEKKLHHKGTDRMFYITNLRIARSMDENEIKIKM